MDPTLRRSISVVAVIGAGAKRHVGLDYHCRSGDRIRPCSAVEAGHVVCMPNSRQKAELWLQHIGPKHMKRSSTAPWLPFCTSIPISHHLHCQIAYVHRIISVSFAIEDTPILLSSLEVRDTARHHIRPTRNERGKGDCSYIFPRRARFQANDQQTQPSRALEERGGPQSEAGPRSCRN
jgi:hypothetical protein